MIDVKRWQLGIMPWFALAFILWCICFWPFLTGKVVLQSDAISYYDHTKYYVEYLAKGVFPLWDHWWLTGAPNDFFLQRLGAYNPFYLILAIFVKLGIPFKCIYFIGIALYFWLGAFFLYRLLRDHFAHLRLIAFSAAIIFVFSSLSTRLFDSYMHLIITPAIAFMYCLLGFLKQANRRDFWGITLSLAILASTYIPLYSFIFIAIVLVVLAVVYYDHVQRVIKETLNFISAFRWDIIVAGFIIAAIIALQVLFIKQLSTGDVALPMRKSTIEATNNLMANQEHQKWGTLEELVYVAMISDLRLYRFGVIYIPVMALVILAFTFFQRLNRRLLAMALIAIAIFFISSHNLFGVYYWLRDHISILKVIRNLHFFCWFFLIPLSFVWMAELWQVWLVEKKKFNIFAFIVAIFIIAFLLFSSSYVLITTIIAIILTLVLLIILQINFLKDTVLTYVLIIAAVSIQALQVYYYLPKNIIFFHQGSDYEKYDEDFNFKNRDIYFGPSNVDENTKPSIYYASKYSLRLLQMLKDPSTLNSYVYDRLIAYHHVMSIPDEKIDHERFVEWLTGKVDLAVVEGKEVKLILDSPTKGVQYFEGDSAQLKILKANPNLLRLAVDFKETQLLVYNDTYDPRWHVYVNGKEQHLERVNVAFKGVILPPGKAEVEFRYGYWYAYVFHWFMLLAFMSVLIMIIKLSLSKRGDHDGIIA